MRSQQPPIVDAVLRGDMEELARLLGDSRGADPDERRGGFAVSYSRYAGGETALWLASRRGDVDAMRVLLEHNADVGLADNVGQTPLHMAALLGRIDALSLLIEHGAPLDAVNASGETPLHNAAFAGELSCTRLLEDAGADSAVLSGPRCAEWPRVGDLGGLTSADLARQRAEAIFTPKASCAPIADAVVAGNEEELSHLLANLTASPNQRHAGSTFGDPCILLAAEHGHVEEMQLLLQRHADVALTGVGRQTALHRAALHGQEAALRMLIKHGAQLDACDGVGETALHNSARCGSAECTRWLLVEGAAASHPNRKGETPLHLAAISGRQTALSVLISKDPDLNAIDLILGETALHYAAKAGHYSCVRLLLKASAAPEIRNYEQTPPMRCRTALDYAEARNDTDTITLIADPASIPPPVVVPATDADAMAVSSISRIDAKNKPLAMDPLQGELRVGQRVCFNSSSARRHVNATILGLDVHTVRVEEREGEEEENKVEVDQTEEAKGSEGDKDAESGESEHSGDTLEEDTQDPEEASASASASAAEVEDRKARQATAQRKVLYRVRSDKVSNVTIPLS